MKKYFSLLVTLLLMSSTMSAQYMTQAAHKQPGRWQAGEITSGYPNKPNGTYFRLREEVMVDLPAPYAMMEFQLMISEPTSDGFWGYYRTPLSKDYYGAAYVVFFNSDREQQGEIVGLLEEADIQYGEVEDVRYDEQSKCLYYNIVNVGTGTNTPMSRLYCYNVAEKRMVWKTDTNVSSDIIVLYDNFVFSYSGKSVYMIDKNTGKIYSKLATHKIPSYMEISREDANVSRLSLLDYDECLYIYDVHMHGTKPGVSSSVQNAPTGKIRR